MTFSIFLNEMKFIENEWNAFEELDFMAGFGGCMAPSSLTSRGVSARRHGLLWPCAVFLSSVQSISKLLGAMPKFQRQTTYANESDILTLGQNMLSN